eukprot:SAG22_NODE_1058_length_5769_cov_6.433510_8_plen_96_part_00
MRLFPLYKPEIGKLTENLFYEDKDNGYTETLVWGLEGTMMVWIAWNVAMWRYLTEETTVAVCIAYAVYSLTIYAREYYGQANIASKTLVDPRFLL